jgi:osmotically-inducible protein OsmY
MPGSIVRFPLAMLVMLLATAPALSASEVPTQNHQKEAEIERALVALLGSDASTIHALVIYDKAILVGEVEHRETGEMAKEIALSVDGIKRVRDRVQARDELRLTEGLTLAEGKDAQLEIEVKHAISRDNHTLANAIEVEACAGVVSLRGVVGTQEQKARALQIAANVVGVTKVLDLLRSRG